MADFKMYKTYDLTIRADYNSMLTYKDKTELLTIISKELSKGVSKGNLPYGNDSLTWELKETYDILEVENEQR